MFTLKIMFRPFTSSSPSFNRYLRRLRASLVTCFLLGMVLSLTGCIQYEVGVNYAGQFHGEITQQIDLDERFTHFDPDAMQTWLNSIQSRARQLGGRTRSPAPNQMIVTIPFNNGHELETKFNRFFQSSVQIKDVAQVQTMPQIKPHLELTESNLLLVLRNHLTLDVDLRSLDILNYPGIMLLYPGDLVNLEFKLTTPWSAHVSSPKAVLPQAAQSGKQLLWHLTAGQINHLEVIFWVPSPLGWGAVVISLLVGMGYWLKRKIPDFVKKSGF